ncbi:MAG: hydroxymethylbilane synthase [Williamsia sp.]|nr:hydroxymethylbilane synthase [Williamsia sp.]
MSATIRIGTRESQLAVWQASQVQSLLAQQNISAELVYIKSEGDIDLKTPLYEIGVQGIFTKSLDIALLENRIDLAVHSLKDVPTQLPLGIRPAAVLKRGPVGDLLVYKTQDFLNDQTYQANIATSSIRRRALWLSRYPNHVIHNLRGNVNTRLKKLEAEPWDAAIFAQAGLERVGLRPQNSLVLEWMLPAPAQGAIVTVCRAEDENLVQACQHFNDPDTALCTKIERDFLRALQGGCSTPVSALALVQEGKVYFRGSIVSLDGSKTAQTESRIPVEEALDLGEKAAAELLRNGGREIADSIRHAER